MEVQADRGDHVVRFAIATIRSEAPGRPRYDIGDELDPDEFERYRQALVEIFTFVQNHQFSLVERNHQSIVALAANYANQSIVKQRNRRPSARDLFPLMSALVNWLTSVRLFVDHSEAAIKRRYGKHSPQAARFKEATSAAFDECFAYRFFAKLRNYTQHCGLPMTGATFSLVDTNDSEPRSRVEFYLDRDKLLADYRKGDWSARVWSELSAMPPKIEIIGLISEAMIQVRRIMRSILELRAPHAVEAARLLLPIVEDLDTGDNQIVLLRDMVKTPDEKTTFSQQYFPRSEAIRQFADLDPIRDLDEMFPLTPPTPTEAVVPTELRKRAERGTAVLNAWMGPDGVQECQRVVRELFERDGSIEPTITGILNITGFSLSLAAAAVGTTREEVLGRLLQSDDVPPDDGEDASGAVRERPAGQTTE